MRARALRPAAAAAAVTCGFGFLALLVVRTLAAERAERPVPFRVGESLEYDVGWSSYLTAGTATLTVQERKASYNSVAYYVVAEGRSSGIVGTLYPAYYKADTLIDVYTLFPQRGSIYSQEGGHRKLRVTTFDQSKRNAEFQVTPGGSTPRKFPLSAPTHDAVSVVLALRTLALRDGLDLSLPVSDGGKVFAVKATVRGRERLSTRLGQVMTWRVEPAIVGDTGEIGARGLTVWISDDPRRLPMRMEAEMPVGTFNLTLRKVQP